LNSPVTGLFYNERQGVFLLRMADGSEIIAGKVVLAMPPRALELIAANANVPESMTGAPLAELLPQIRQSAPIPLFKIFLVYDSDWWSPSLAADWPAFTRMTTDMPMRQIYNFGQATDSFGKTYYLFQAVYCDSLKAGYWAGLMPQEGENEGEDLNTDIFSRIENLAGSTIETGTLQFGTTDNLSNFPLFEAAHQQFSTMVGAVAEGQSLPPPSPLVPVAGAAMNWGTDPFGGGVNFWNVGVQLDDGQGGGGYWEMMNPAPNLYVVGEGYSLYQGWVEGALWSAEDMLERFFGLTSPGWLVTTPYSGPGEHVPVIAAGQGPAAVRALREQQ
ncbi:MAG TPA: FAD-dependent oxidoreductase, partial [Allosphingosinicella sp.]|nr:FAD-dependent oxidoreductase [Allosphingosinicella sp.]